MKYNCAVLMVGLIGLMAGDGHAASKSTEGKPLDMKKITLATYAKSFVGQGNVTVDVAPYKGAGTSGALVWFKGIESPWDGKVINHDVRPGAYGSTEYVTIHNGAVWTSLTQRKDAQGNLRYELFVPGVDDSLSLAPSDGAAQLTSPKAILDEYRRQHGMKGVSK